jgi:hypothetical protein
VRSGLGGQIDDAAGFQCGCDVDARQSHVASSRPSAAVATMKSISSSVTM